MASGKITKRTVDAMKPSDRDQFLWDTDRKGFGVKRTPAGKLVYLIQYRVHCGRGAKVKRYTIGSHGAWTPDAAGKEAERLLRLVGQGIDPGAQKERLRTEARELAFSAYADNFLKLYVKPNWPRSYDFPESAIRLYMKPHFRDTPLPQIETKAIIRFYDGLPGGKPGLRRNVHVVLRRLMRWAKGRGDIASDPFEGFEAPAPVASRDRVLTENEVRTLWLATDDIATPFGAFVRLLLLTGQRRNEVAGIDWKELSRERREWLVPAARAKNGVENLLPLSDQAIAELDELARCDKWPRRGLVFTTTGKTPISGFSKAKRLLDKAILKRVQKDDPHAELDDWRFHDLRRTMATNMQRLRISGDVIEACENRIAGRSKSGSARTYQRHDYEPEKREAMEKWGAFVASLMAKKDNVVPLAKAG